MVEIVASRISREARLLEVASQLAMTPGVVAGGITSYAGRSAGQGRGRLVRHLDEVKLTLVAENTKFDKAILETPAGKDVVLTMENKDSIEHSFALYQTEAATERLAGGQTFPGPAILTYQFTAPETPGTYHFRCDIHPNAMNGDFVVK